MTADRRDALCEVAYLLMGVRSSGWGDAGRGCTGRGSGPSWTGDLAQLLGWASGVPVSGEGSTSRTAERPGPFGAGRVFSVVAGTRNGLCRTILTLPRREPRRPRCASKPAGVSPPTSRSPRYIDSACDGQASRSAAAPPWLNATSFSSLAQAGRVFPQSPITPASHPRVGRGASARKQRGTTRRPPPSTAQQQSAQAAHLPPPRY